MVGMSKQRGQDGEPGSVGLRAVHGVCPHSEDTREDSEGTGSGDAMTRLMFCVGFSSTYNPFILSKKSSTKLQRLARTYSVPGCVLSTLHELASSSTGPHSVSRRKPGPDFVLGPFQVPSCSFAIERAAVISRLRAIPCPSDVTCNTLSIKGSQSHRDT